MDTDKIDFGYVQQALLNGTIKEVLELKRALNSVDDEDISKSDGYSEEFDRLVVRIVQTSNGLRQIATVMSYFDAMKESGDVPQLNTIEESEFFDKVWI